MNPTTSATTKPHCDLCILSPEEVKNVANMFFIFLDMDGVMIPLSEYDDHKKLKQLFGKPEEGYTYYQFRVARAHKIYEKCVSHLANFIEEVKKSGKEPQIVISSSWGHDGTTEQVCREMFQSQPSFSSYIVGRTPSQEGWDPEVKRLIKEKKESFREKSWREYGFDLTFRAHEIEYWLREHRVDHPNFVVFDDCRDKLPEIFGSRFVRVSPILTDKHIAKAQTILHNPHTYDFSESLATPWNSFHYPIPKLFFQFRKIQILNLSGNNLLHLEEEVFTLVNLRELHLEYNQLTSLSQSISKLKKLSKLFLQHNRIAHLPGEISHNKKLKVLDLSNNQITELPPEILTLARLEKLDLSNNELSSLPARIEYMKRLKEIDISGNHFPPDEIIVFPDVMKRLSPFQKTYSLPEKGPEESNCTYLKKALKEIAAVQDKVLGKKFDFTGLSWIEALDKIEEREKSVQDKALCNFCQAVTNQKMHMEDFPSDKSALGWRTWLKKRAPEFKSLTVEFSELKLIPSEIAWFMNLESLDIGDNELDRLPPSITSLQKLKELNLGGNRFKTLPQELSSFSNLERLKIMLIPLENPYDSINQAVLNFPNLKLLDISDLNLRKLPKNIFKLAQLQELNIETNNFTTLPPEIGQLTNLNILRIFNNQLRSFPDELYSLSKLEWLYAEYNHLEEISDKIGNLKNLRLLSLFENLLRSLPPRIAELPHLKFLDLSDNDISADAIVTCPLLMNRILALQNVYSLLKKTPEESNCAYLERLFKEIAAVQDKVLGEKFDFTEMPWVNALDQIEEREESVQDKALCDFCQAMTNQKMHIEDFPSDKSARGWRAWLKKWAPKFTKLTLHLSRLKLIPNEISWFVNLENLDLRFNRLDRLPPSITSLQKLKELNLGGNRFKTLPQELPSFSNLERLEINLNPLENPDDSINQAVRHFPNLQSLNISTLNLLEIPENIFELRQLQELIFETNHLITLPPEIGQLTNLTTLSVIDNQLRSFPGELYSLLKLENLYADHNSLKGISDEIGNFKNLRELALKNNHLQSLPPGLAELQHLELLDLSDNDIPADAIVTCPLLMNRILALQNAYCLSEKAPEESNCAYLEKLFKEIATAQDDVLDEKFDFTAMPWVNALDQIERREKLVQDKKLCDFCQGIERKVHLNLDGNIVTHRPLCREDFPSDKGAEVWREWLKEWAPKFKKLALHSSRLKLIPSEIAWFVNLESLGLFINQLDRLPPSISSLRKLKELDLGSNEFKTLPQELSSFSNLERLDFAANPLKNPVDSVNQAVLNYPKLKSLDISRLDLWEFPENIFKLGQLQELIIATNDLNTLPPEIGRLTNLTKLNLFNNGLWKLPEEFYSLSKLEVINLSYTCLGEISDKIGNFKNLRELALGGNLISKLPQVVWTLTTIEQLDLSPNRFTTLPPEVANLENLWWLSIQGNPCKEDPEWVHSLPKLQYLNSEKITKV